MATKDTKKTATKASKTFSAEEVEAMKEYVREKRQARKGKPDGEGEVLAKIATMKGADRVMAEKIHAIVKANAPGLTPKTWYGMPAYANSAGKVVCFFQDANKFKSRYATLGFSDAAKLDDGNIWPATFALAKLTPADEARIGALVKKAVS